MTKEKQLNETRQYWDAQATSFDQEPDHGLNDLNVLAAWTELLNTSLPTPPANLLDIGCGTGSLSIVLAQLGHHVTAIDLSPAMIEQAKKKTAVAELLQLSSSNVRSSAGKIVKSGINWVGSVRMFLTTCTTWVSIRLITAVANKVGS